jgi:monoterpene epsilon-lactone hydrolase
MNKNLIRLTISLVLALFACGPSYAQEFPPMPGVKTLPERTVPVPPGLSPELSAIIGNHQIPPYIPAPTSLEGWLEMQRMWDEPFDEMSRVAAKNLGATYEPMKIAGVPCYLVTPNEIDERFKDLWFVHIHGGAFVFGGGEAAVREALWMADGCKARVLSIDYRRPPVHPFPAAIEDAVAVWKAVIQRQDAAATPLFGTSAGGNLTLATTLKLKELGLPLPGALFTGTPAVDLKETSDTWITLQGLDPLGQRGGLIDGTFEVYVPSGDLGNPLVSPIYGDLKGFPPTILISGTRDLLLSDTVRMHRALRKAGVDAQLHVYDGQSHGDYMQGLLYPNPESRDAQAEILRFFDIHLKR